MELSEEEKKIIDRINRSYDDNTQYVEASAKDWNYIVHSIRQRQKETEELKEKNAQLTNYLNDSYYVSADEIREIIKEYRKQLQSADTERTAIMLSNFIMALNDLLEE